MVGIRTLGLALGQGVAIQPSSHTISKKEFYLLWFLHICSWIQVPEYINALMSIGRVSPVLCQKAVCMDY